MANRASDVVLRMKGITKTFPGVVALDNVSFDQRRGEIHALVGENGAGKSTLMKTLGGAYIPDSGTIELFEEDVEIAAPIDALALGISVIYQEFNLVPELSVADNVFLGKEIRGRLPQTLDRRTMKRKAHEALESLGLGELETGTLVRDLSVAQQQLVEIGKALFNDARILVMDEPTAVLSQNESARLFSLMADLRRQGISIIYISHRLDEVLEMGDRITVLRDGEIVTTYDNRLRTVTKDELVRSMVGRDIEEYFPDRTSTVADKTLLEVREYAREGVFTDVSFELRRGEILGFYGLVGAGRSEIMRSISGIDPHDHGEITIDGKRVVMKSVDDAMKAGLVIVPEDRKRDGLVTCLTLSDNVALPNLSSLHVVGALSTGKVRALVQRFVELLGIRPAMPRRLVKDFSGGNQQKAVIAKWLASDPRVIIFDEPTRGIDVGAKSEIYQIIADLSEKGVGVIIVSSEILEILGMCDRIAVVRNGEIQKIIKTEDATQELLVQTASGF